MNRNYFRSYYLLMPLMLSSFNLYPRESYFVNIVNVEQQFDRVYITNLNKNTKVLIIYSVIFLSCHYYSFFLLTKENHND